MIPPVEFFASACALLSARFGWALSARDEEVLECLEACRDEAERLAAQPEDEPAAIVYALSAFLHRFGEEHVALPAATAARHAESLGLSLDLDNEALGDALAAWSRAIADGVMTFDALRLWLGQHLAGCAG